MGPRGGAGRGGPVRQVRAGRGEGAALKGRWRQREGVGSTWEMRSDSVAHPWGWGEIRCPARCGNPRSPAPGCCTPSSRVFPIGRPCTLSPFLMPAGCPYRMFLSLVPICVLYPPLIPSKQEPGWNSTKVPFSTQILQDSRQAGWERQFIGTTTFGRGGENASRGRSAGQSQAATQHRRDGATALLWGFVGGEGAGWRPQTPSGSPRFGALWGLILSGGTEVEEPCEGGGEKLALGAAPGCQPHLWGPSTESR